MSKSADSLGNQCPPVAVASRVVVPRYCVGICRIVLELLRFEPALEREFRTDHVERHAAIAVFSVFVLEHRLSPKVDWILGGLICPVLLLCGVMLRVCQPRHAGRITALALLTAGLGFAYCLSQLVLDSHQPPYGFYILLIFIMYGYFFRAVAERSIDN